MALYKGDKLLAAGASGKSAYDAALEGGYKGTEEEFNIFMSNATVNYVQPDEPVDAQDNAFWLDTDDDFQIDVEGVVAAHNVSEDAHEDIRKAIKDMNVSVSNAGFKVGDTFTTLRRDLGDEWALCNGATLSKKDYPEAAKFCTSSNTLVKISDSTQCAIADSYYDNGIWVAVGYKTANNYPCVLTATDPAGTWTIQQISNTATYLQGVYCYEGTWVATGYTVSGNYPYIFITTDPTGDWTARQISNTSATIKKIHCYNGTWIIAGTSSSSAYAFIATDLKGDWTMKNLSSSASASSVYCYEGQWVIVGTGSTAPTAPYVFTTTDPTGTWTRKKLSSGQNYTLQDVYCYNGTWVAVGYISGGPYGMIYYTTDPTGDWSSRATSSDTNGSYLYGIGCCNGTWIAAGRFSSNGSNNMTAAIFTATNPAGTWTSSQYSAVTAGSFNSVSVSDNIFTVFGYSNSISTYYPYILHNLYMKLPTVSITNAYTYIKAKEGN